MQSLLVLTILLLWCSFIFGEQRILSPVHDELHTQASALSQTEVETDDSNLVDVTADRRHHPVHPKPHHPHHPNTKKYHPHHPAPKHPHGGSKRHHPHESESLSDATDVTPVSSSSSSNVVPVVALEPALTSAAEQLAQAASPQTQPQTQTQTQSETADSNLVEADRRHHPVHPKPHPKWHHPHSSKKPFHPHHPAGSRPHGPHPHRPHRPHDSPSSLLSDSASSSSVSPPAGVPAELILAAEQSADDLSDLLVERAELAKISDQLSALELQVVDAQTQQYKLAPQIAAAQKALHSQEAATALLLLEQGYHAVADRDMTRYAAEMETMKMKVKTAASALHALQEEQKLRENNLKALLLQEADIASDHKLQVEITKKANELYCSNVCKSVKLTNCLAATSACDVVPKVKAVDWINSV